MSNESVNNLSRAKTKELCVAHQCPKCGVDHHVTIEEVVKGAMIVTMCHCRACGHSWHPTAMKPAQS